MRGVSLDHDSKWLRSERPAKPVVLALLALKLVLLAAFAWRSRFVMDEFLQLGYAKYLGHELFDTLWPPKAVGFAVFYKMAHLVGWDATSILLIGRMQTALLACGTLAMVYACARVLGESRLRALIIILVLLSFSNMMERIFRTIAEPLALFFAVAALLAILRGRADKPRTLFIGGVLSGLSFLATQKAVYFDVALGVALAADAVVARRHLAGLARGAWLVLGWVIPVAAYCVIFGAPDPVPVARSLVLGPVEVASAGIAAEYGGLRHFALQTLVRNALLYCFCFGGMFIELLRIARLDARRRIALIFSIIVTGLVFAHNQPWPYVFIMALPFMALWALVPIDLVSRDRSRTMIASAALAFQILFSFGRNIQYLQIDNRAQLALVARAEVLTAPGEVYFDGIGMLPNRPEPSTLWLDRHYVLKTLHEREKSEAYRIFADHPPKVVLWTYRMDAVEPVLWPFIRDSYVQIAPNIRVAGKRLVRGRPISFDVPVLGRYALYSDTGEPVKGEIEIGGTRSVTPLQLNQGRKDVTLIAGAEEALLLPEGSYGKAVRPGGDNKSLFDDVYD